MAIPIPQRTIISPTGDPVVARTEIELAIANGGVYVFDTTKDIYVTAVEQSYTQQYVTNQTITNNPGNIANGVQFNNNGVFAADANFTYNAGTDTLNLENLTIFGGVANLGPVANIRIANGTSGQVLSTNGSGGLSWISVSGVGNSAAIANGNSNVNIGTANGNITLSAVGNANILTITGTGANIVGTANITGDVIAGGNVNVTSNINGARIQNGNSNISITSNANIVFGVTGNANVFTVDANSVTVKSTNGNLVLGRATATGSPGLSSTTSFTLNANRGNTEKVWTFGTDGNLTLSGNVGNSFIKYGNGQNYTGNIGFVDDAIYDYNGIIVENADRSHGATAALIIPSNGDSNAIQVNNYYGNITLSPSSNGAGGSQTWTFDTVGALNLPNQGVVRNRLNQDVNIVANSFVQLQWTTVNGVNSDDPNSTTELTHWLYLDPDGAHIETNINSGNASYFWNFGTDGNTGLPGSINFANSSINVATANFIGVYPVGNITDQTYLELLEGANGYAALTSNTNIILTSGKGANVGNSWIFDAAGVLSLPQNLGVGAAVIQPSAADFGLELIVNGGTWTYGTDASLTIPGNINLPAISSHVGVNANVGLSVIPASVTKLSNDANVSVVANSTGTTQTWTFDSTGNLTVPGAIYTPNNISIGNKAGNTSQGSNSVAIGTEAGFDTQGQNSVAVGPIAGRDTQGIYAVAVGQSAGSITQGQGSVAVGESAGYELQGTQSVAVGSSAGYNTQGNSAVAIGANAASYYGSDLSIAIGYQAGFSNLASSAIAIGANAGVANTTNNSVYIGAGAGANGGNFANVVVLSASTSNLTPVAGNGFYVNPIRASNANVVTNTLSYNSTTKEITYVGATISSAFNAVNPIVEMDNARFAIDGSGNPTVGAITTNWSGPYSVQAQLWNGTTYPVTTVGSNNATWNTAFSGGIGVTFANAGDQATGYFTNNTNSHIYKVTWIAASVGAASGNGFIQVQRLV